MKNLFLVFALILSFSVSAQKGRTAEVGFSSSTKCGMCKKTIENNLGKEKGVKVVNVDLKENKVNVTYDTKKTNAETIKKKITLIGYDADELVADQKAHDALPGCCQKTARPHKD